VYKHPLLPQEKIGRGGSSPDFFLREEATSVHRLWVTTHNAKGKFGGHLLLKVHSAVL